jgi:zinc protease
MPSAVSNGVRVNYQKYTLSNGLDVILHVDRNIPFTAVNLWYHVGSGREKPGKSGFAHLFEHMMFQGSANAGAGLHFRIIEESGGTLNGSTSTDRTNYWEYVPRNYLETALWLESDRMGWLLPAMTQQKLDNQRDVVINERLQNYDNRPYGLAFEILSQHLYPSDHPYSWLTIGSIEDLKNASLTDVKDFFSAFYGPHNASLCIGGDIDIDETEKLVEKYFGPIPSGPDVLPPVPEIPKIQGEKRLIHEDTVQLPRLYIAWHSTYLYGPYDAAMDIVSDILAHGKNSRLYKSLVYEKQIAQDVNAYHLSREMGSLFIVSATAKPGTDLEQIEAVIEETLRVLPEEGVQTRELERIKNSHRAMFINSLQRVGGFFGITDRLNEFNTFLRDPGLIHDEVNRYISVTDDEILDAVRAHLHPEDRIVLHVLPKANRKTYA